LSDDATELAFSVLPPLPQTASLKRVSAVLWADEDVIALWLGGSFARGEADEYSDIDLRVAVRPEAEERWRRPDMELLFGGELSGYTPFPLGGGQLHHLALTSGDIYDLWVQTTEEAPFEDAALVLGCRDEAFGQRLSATEPAPTTEPVPADPAAVRQLVSSFWINSLKHRKVLNRGLDLVAQTGIGMERALLQRLWFIAATGRDGASSRPTIHTLTELDRVVMGAQGTHGLSLTGGPLTSRREIMQAIEANRDEVAALGRRLAVDLGFDYPEALERTVRETWRQYLDRAPKGYEWATKRLGAAAIITDGRGYVLMVKHSYGLLNWEIPGGAADADESVADTAVREVREETSLDVTAERLTGMYYWAENDSHHFVFRCSVAHEGQEPLSISDETTDCGFFAPDALPRPISDFTVRRIQDALAGETPSLPIHIGPRQWLE
jgi:8-oxo-dGTP diphosphatase